jgi:hypothetical protein
MATRSTIGIMNSDSTVTAVYCHWDGYPEYNGNILMENYNTEAKVRELIGLGSISSLGEKIGEKHPFSKYELKEGEVYDEAAYEGMTTFYGRDRGEQNVEASTFTDSTEFVRDFSEEYNYLFINGTWYVNQYAQERGGYAVFDLVEHVLEQREAASEYADA